MSELKTNKISTNDQNNVAIDNALGLKSYDTTGRDALTSVAGDMIYNTTLGNPQVYDGSSWNDLKAGVEAVSIEYLVIAGGGGSAGGIPSYQAGGAGGAGGYRTNKTGQTSGGGDSAEPTLIVPKSSNLTVTVGAGGSAGTTATGSSNDAHNGQTGNNSVFSYIISLGGGGGSEYYSRASRGTNPADSSMRNQAGLVGSGGGGCWAEGAVGIDAGVGRTGQGFNGGIGQGSVGGSNIAGGGGGGAGAVGGNASTATGGNGGVGVSSDITGSSITRAGGGGGASNNAGAGGSGGGGAGGAGSGITTGTAGTVNTGGGAGAGRASNTGSGTGGSAGGSGVVILRWATADATIGATRTGLTDGDVQTDGSDSYIVFTGGTGTITFS